MQDFVHDVPASRVVFGAGRRKELVEELTRLSLGRALLVTDPALTAGRELAEELGPLLVGRFDGVVMHVPVEVARRAVKAARSAGADCVVAVGGGSAIGIAKAVANETHLPVVAVPTTYAGSEMTPIWGITENHRKTTGRDPNVLPK
ncbi:MAG: iron-containing alcohol dehydrogenase, partial [Jiangellaceae bacterium]